MKDWFRYTSKENNELYDLMHRQGKERFGSDCRHEKVVKGRCANCLRKVVGKRG